MKRIVRYVVLSLSIPLMSMFTFTNASAANHEGVKSQKVHNNTHHNGVRNHHGSGIKIKLFEGGRMWGHHYKGTRGQGTWGHHYRKDHQRVICHWKHGYKHCKVINTVKW